MPNHKAIPATAPASLLTSAVKKSLALHALVLGLVVALPYLHTPPEVKSPTVVEAILVAPNKVTKPSKPIPIPIPPAPEPAPEIAVETPPVIPPVEVAPKPHDIPVKPEPAKEIPKVALPTKQPPEKPVPEKAKPVEPSKPIPPSPIIKKPTLDTRAFDAEMQSMQQDLLKDQMRDQLKAEAAKAEAAARDQANQGLRNKYQRLINQRIVTKWNKPQGARSGMFTTLRITVLPGGEIVSVITVQSSGSAAFDASAEEAVKRASPLPVPEDPTVFRQYFSTITLKFNPEDLQ